MPERDPEAKALFQLTREMELLISAALVFALLQLPAALDDWFAANSLHVGGVSFFTVFVVYYVGKLVAYGLIVAISAHFLLRGFWVAIMSLRSVYPGGVDREKLEQGEIYRKFYDERLMTLNELEDRVDRMAASIFAFVFLFLLLFLMLIVCALAAMVLALIVAKVTGDDSYIGPVVIGSFVLYLVLQSYVALVDKISKTKPLAPKVEGSAMRLMRWMYYPTFNFLYAPVFFTFSTNTSRRRMTALLIAFLYSMIAVFMFSIFLARGIIGFDSYSYYPSQAREAQLRAVHYDSLRAEGTAATAPSIQSDVVEGPYVRLFIPYNAREDNERMRVLCPGVKPVRADGMFVAPRGTLAKERVDEIAACFERIYTIELDGRRIEKPGFLFYRHPEGRIAGRLALLPASSLVAGRHLLIVRPAPLPDRKKDARDDAAYIPFWR
ncbi:MAG TPA: hypothetical protein VF608_05410 [Thermoanaerobaculia bacterium]